MPKTSIADAGLIKPFWVVTDDTENFHSGYSSPDKAQSGADQANEKAEDMGLKTRYKVIPKPS